MDIQFSLWPIGDEHLEDEMKEVQAILDESGLKYDMNVMSTTLSGDWDKVMSCIKQCHETLRKRHSRVLCQIVIDDDAT
jgi:uncharacterized protein YqgV (UPF0045/DUF77 family)